VGLGKSSAATWTVRIRVGANFTRTRSLRLAVTLMSIGPTSSKHNIARKVRSPCRPTTVQKGQKSLVFLQAFLGLRHPTCCLPLERFVPHRLFFRSSPLHLRLV